MELFAKERHDKIYDMVCKNGAVSTSDLVKLFGVSIETVRRDLLEMENKGLLARVHGGAVKVGEMPPFYDLAKRHQSRSAEKTALAQIAITEVNEGDFIAVDSGSTAIHFTEALRDHFTNLTVVTYSLDVLEILRDHKSIQTILCGGHYLHQENSLVCWIICTWTKPLSVPLPYLLNTVSTTTSPILRWYKKR